MGKLQIIIIAVSVVLAVIALLIFGGILPGFRRAPPGQTGEISFWGPVPETVFSQALADFDTRFRSISVTYREIKSEIYTEELINALASGRGPDVFVLPQDHIVKHKDKVFILTQDTYPLRAYRDNFLELATVYVTPEGIIGLPFQVDPLVLYWNRDLFQSAGLIKTPTTWDEFQNAAESLKIVDGQTILQAGAAMGTFNNIKNAKDILALLMLQTGSAIVDPETLRPVFANRGDEILSPAEEALLLFNSFSDPRKDTYTWNRFMPEALEAFSSGRLAMYIGYASDLNKILAKNPHLNFDVAEVPQIRNIAKITFGKSFALVISRQSQNIAASLTFMYDLTDFNQQKLIAENSLVPPTLRTLLAQKQENPILDVFYKAAIRSHAWLDPDPARTLSIWKEMVESVLSGAKKINKASSDAQAQFTTLIPRDGQ